MGFLKFIVLSPAIYFLAAQGSFSQKSDTVDLKREISAILKGNEFKNALIGIFVVDTKTDEVLFQHNQDLLLSPASSLKVVTTAAALEVLGPSHVFHTKIYYTGEISADSILNGDIIIKGYGDPSFYSDLFTEHYKKNDVFALTAAKIREAGITKVTGNIIGDASYYTDNQVPPSWTVSDVANYFGAMPSALSVCDNEYSLFFKTGVNENDSSGILKIVPEIPGLVLRNFVLSRNVNDDNSVIFGGQFDSFRIITGGLPLNKNGFEVRGSIPDPPFFAAYMLKTSMEKAAIEITGSVKSVPGQHYDYIITDSLKFIFDIPSPPLSEIIIKTNMRSINLYAEHLARQICINKTGKTDFATTLDALNAFWMPVTGKLLLSDGSGLSRFNAVSARQLVTVLCYMKNKSRNYEYFYNSLPVASKNGSIRNMFKNTFAENNLRAKSGTLNGVRSYTGYVTSKSGKKIAFSVIINNYTSNSSVIKSKIEEILVKLSMM